MTLRSNDGPTEDENKNGVLTKRRIYRAHNRQMDCLKILYPELAYIWSEQFWNWKMTKKNLEKSYWTRNESWL